MASVRRLAWWAVVALTMSVSGPARADPPPAIRLPTEKFATATGEPFALPGPGACAGIVLIFIGHDCPISNAYSKEIVRLGRAFAAKNVSVCVVYADADLGADAARRHAKDYGFTCPALLDPKLTLARAVGATIKPEAVVLSPRGELMYRGRINDRYVDFGKRREQVTRHDLQDAVEAVLAGRPVPTPRAPAIGCDIDFRPVEK
jgi:hypothetical protein